MSGVDFDVTGSNNIVYHLNNSPSTVINSASGENFDSSALEASLNSLLNINPRACLSLHQVKEKLDAGFVQIVDVRDASSFNLGSIPNAINETLLSSNYELLPSFLSNLDKKLNPRLETIFMCNTGNSASLAWQKYYNYCIANRPLNSGSNSVFAQLGHLNGDPIDSMYPRENKLFFCGTAGIDSFLITYDSNSLAKGLPSVNGYGFDVSSSSLRGMNYVVTPDEATMIIMNSLSYEQVGMMNKNYVFDLTKPKINLIDVRSPFEVNVQASGDYLSMLGNPTVLQAGTSMSDMSWSNLVDNSAGHIEAGFNGFKLPWKDNSTVPVIRYINIPVSPDGVNRSSNFDASFIEMVPDFSSSTNIFFCKSGNRAAMALDGSGSSPSYGTVPGGLMKDLADQYRSSGMRVLRVSPGSFYQLNHNFNTQFSPDPTNSTI